MAGGEPQMDGTNKYLDMLVVMVIIFGGIFYDKSRDSSVGIETGYGLDDSGVGVRVSVRSRIFSPPDRPDRL
jgi:hypothetical protein